MSGVEERLTDAERKEFERIEDSGETQGLAWRVEQVVAAHVRKVLAAEYERTRPKRERPSFRGSTS